MRIASQLVRAAVVAGVLAAPLAADATIIVPRTLEEMSREAATVVRAKVVARQSAWDADHRRIHTFTELQVLQAVTGRPDATIVVRTMGGEVGDIGMRVAGVARFEVGEEVVVFLRADPVDAGHFQVIGMSQGKFTVDRSGPSPIAVASTEGLAFARRTETGKLEVGEHSGDHLARRVPLADLVARIEQATAGAPKAPSAPNAPNAPTPPSAPTVDPGSTTAE